MKKEYNLKKLKRRPADQVKVDPEAGKMAISIRLDTIVVSNLQNEADRMGLPYQTLINSILHRFVTGQLVDKSAMAGP